MTHVANISIKLFTSFYVCFYNINGYRSLQERLVLRQESGRGLEADRIWLLGVAHVKEMHAAAANVLGHGREVNVRNVLLLTEGLDDRCDLGVVRVVDPREEVMLDLVVEAAIHEAEQGSADVGRRDDLKNDDTCGSEASAK